MNIDNTTIDRIVAGVLSQLRDKPGVKPETSQSKVTLSATVITEELLEQTQLAGNTIILPRRAVVTPSGRDWLRKRSITWTRERDTAAATQQAWKLFVCEKSSAIDRIVEEAGTIGWSIETSTSAEEAGVLGLSELTNGDTQGIVLFVQQPQRIACRLNRHARIRAAAIHSTSELTSIRQQLGPNVLAICAGERGYFELRNLLKQIAAAGPPREPNDW